MKLSEAMRIWRNFVAQFRDGGATLVPAVVREVEQILADLQELTACQEATIELLEAENAKLQAQLSGVLQGRIRPVRLRTEDLGPNVTLFPVVPRPVPATPEGGAA